MLFIYKDDPNSIQAKAKEFAFAEAKRVETKLEFARTALQALENEMDEQLQYAGGNSKWDAPEARKLERIEQEVKLAERQFKTALIKLHWESNRQFSKSIKVHPKAMPTPWKDYPNDWISFFKRRTA